MSTILFIIKQILLWIFLIWFAVITLKYFNAPPALGQIGMFIIVAHFLEKIFKFAETKH